MNKVISDTSLQFHLQNVTNLLKNQRSQILHKNFHIYIYKLKVPHRWGHKVPYRKKWENSLKIEEPLWYTICYIDTSTDKDPCIVWMPLLVICNSRQILFNLVWSIQCFSPICPHVNIHIPHTPRPCFAALLKLLENIFSGLFFTFHLNKFNIILTYII